MIWSIWLAASLICLDEAVGYRRSPLFGPAGPPRGPPHHHPYSKRHFSLNREHFHRGPPPPPYHPKPHFHHPALHGNQVHPLHSTSGQQGAVHNLGQYAASPGGQPVFPVSHAVPYPSQPHPAPVAYPNPNFVQQASAYQAPNVQSVVAQPLPTPTPTPAYLPPPTPYIPPAATYLPAYLKDDDKGPIHTIPAPNLSPADKPAGFDEYMLKSSAAQANLVASHYRTKPQHHYQVAEDTGALFAPDPDPSVPTLKVPPTTDPHSIPSNGQVPLDLYFQQQAEKQQLLQEQVLQQQALQQQALQQQALQHQALQQQALQSQQSDQDDNSLTPQDLFNLLNYQPNVIPESQLQQHVLQPNVQFYSNPLYLQHSQFMNPQYHNFNYDERTQQSAYGTDSFPLQSLSSYFGNPDESHDLLDTVNTNEISKKLDQRDTKKTSEKYLQEKLPFTTLSSKEVANALASLSAAGALNNGEQQLNDHANDNDEIMNQEENRSVSVYESLADEAVSQSHAQARNIEPDSQASSTYNLIKSEKLTDLDLNLESQVQNRNRVRPKRY